MQPTPHLLLDETMLRGATLALIPGDPGRVPRMAKHLTEACPLKSSREYLSYWGLVSGHPVIICSTGIGGPSTAIAIEELAQCGVRTFIRVGTTGAIQPTIRVGDVIVTQAAVRLEGTSSHFAPLEFPAVADHDVTSALIQAAIASRATHHVGITVTSDTFYPGQERYDTFSGRVLPRFQGSIEQWRSLGALNFEMEAATVLTMTRVFGLRAGCVLGVIANRTQSEAIDGGAVETTEELAIRVAIGAASRLLAEQP